MLDERDARVEPLGEERAGDARHHDDEHDPGHDRRVELELPADKPQCSLQTEKLYATAHCPSENAMATTEPTVGYQHRPAHQEINATATNHQREGGEREDNAPVIWTRYATEPT